MSFVTTYNTKIIILHLLSEISMKLKEKYTSFSVNPQTLFTEKGNQRFYSEYSVHLQSRN